MSVVHSEDSKTSLELPGVSFREGHQRHQQDPAGRTSERHLDVALELNEWLKKVVEEMGNTFLI